MSNINYEFHITVENVDKSKFINFCKLEKIKPIILDLQNKDGKKIFEDVMTSHHKIFKSDEEAIQELNIVTEKLLNEGFNVVRKKIEADIKHQNIPTYKNNKKFIKGNYLESHLNVKIKNKDNLEKLKKIAKKFHIHLSQNMFKVNKDKTFTIMLTYRDGTVRLEDFQKKLKTIIDEITINKMEIEKEIIEYAIFDTKIDWDKKWTS